MKGDSAVIGALNDVLCAELTGINQYFIHAMMCHNWRYERLAAHAREESIEEMKHAEQIIERILYLDGVPNMQKYQKITVGDTVPRQHELDLALESDAVARLNRGLEVCREKGDNGSRLLFEKLLEDEEKHVDWLQAQLHQIAEIGLPNYLAQQIEK